MQMLIEIIFVAIVTAVTCGFLYALFKIARIAESIAEDIAEDEDEFE